MARSAVFLDRDGVLNRAIVRDGKPLPPQTLAEFAILPGVPDALRHLRQAGFALVVVTNQPDVARGTQSRSVVEAINLELTSRLPLDAVQVCYHDDADRCACRKPKPGLLVESAASLGLALETSYMVGDRWRDVEAGRAAGCKTILIDRGYSERGDCTPDHHASDLAEAAEWILRQPRRDSGPSASGTVMKTLEQLTVKIFADGADLGGMIEMSRNPLIRGFTTNPTLMRKAGIRDYRGFARDVLERIPNLPISFEVFADEFDEMERQAIEIAGWGKNVFVKIPVTNTRGESSRTLVAKLCKAGVQLNVTALLTLDQVREIGAALEGGPAAFVSVFAGRVADTGVDPIPLMKCAVEQLAAFPNVELIWASPRELLNVFHADEVGCHVITVTNDVLKKLDLVGKDLAQYSLETVRMFYDDGLKAGFTL